MTAALRKNSRRAMRPAASRSARSASRLSMGPPLRNQSVTRQSDGGPRHGPPYPPTLGAPRQSRDAPRVPTARGSRLAARRQDKVRRAADGDEGAGVVGHPYFAEGDGAAAPQQRALREDRG